MNKCIMILSYNHPEITSRAVESALRFHLNIILVHNGSEKKNIVRLQENFKNIEHFIIEKNKGFTGGVNTGLEYVFSKFDWVYFITNDTTIIELPTIDLEVGFYAPLIYFRKLGRIDSLGGVFYPYKGKLQHLKSLDYKLGFKGKYYVPGTAFILHKEVFKSVGKLDESLNTYWEDVDFSMRVHQLNYKMSCEENFKLLHKVGKTCHDNPFYTTYLYQRNRKKISWKYCNILERIVLFTILFKDFLRGLVRLYLKGDKKRLELLKNAIYD